MSTLTPTRPPAARPLATQLREVAAIYATYEVGGASTPDESLMRHEGREYGYVMSGTLGIEIDFEEFELQPGDSIVFDSTRLIACSTRATSRCSRSGSWWAGPPTVVADRAGHFSVSMIDV